MKIVFFGTSDVGLPTLEKLIQHHQVVGVVTSPDAPVGRKQVLTPSPIAARAQELGLTILKPAIVKKNVEVLEELKKLGADVYIVVSYGKILPKELIDAPPLKTLNIHFSLLPLYRGAAPIQSALMNGDTVTGTTIFILDEFMDHGPVLSQVTETIQVDDTFPTLAARMANISADELIRILPLYESGQITPKEQNHDLATKAPIIKKEDGRIDWSKPALDIYNTWRAYQPWPGIYTTLPSVALAKEGGNGKLLKIVGCKPIDVASILQGVSSGSPPKIGGARGGMNLPGTVIDGGIIACGNSTYLQILALQPEGKQPMDMKSFLNGNKEFVGSRLF